MAAFYYEREIEPKNVYPQMALIYIILMYQTVINHGLKKVDRKEKGIMKMTVR